MCCNVVGIPGKYSGSADFKPNQPSNAQVFVCCHVGAALDTDNVDMGVLTDEFVLEIKLNFFNLSFYPQVIHLVPGNNDGQDEHHRSRPARSGRCRLTDVVFQYRWTFFCIEFGPVLCFYNQKMVVITFPDRPLT